MLARSGRTLPCTPRRVKKKGCWSEYILKPDLQTTIATLVAAGKRQREIARIRELTGRRSSRPFVHRIKAALVAHINVGHPQGQKTQIIQGRELRPQVGLRTQSWLFSCVEAKWVEIGAYVYIAFVGLAYNALLCWLWMPSSYRALVNESLHTVVPVLAVFYWVLFVPRFHLSLRRCALWLVLSAALSFDHVMARQYVGFLSVLVHQ